nr:hypothetical protein 12 [Balneolaceae bacterium]
MRKKLLNRKDKIEAAIRYVYAHFLEEDEDISDLIDSQKPDFANARHAMRSRLYWRMSITQQQIADAESKIKGSKLSTSTIHHSLSVVAKGKVSKKALERIDQLLDEFEEYWKEMNQPALRDRIKFYNKVPRHVLAIMLGMAENFGWANPTHLKGLYNEFKTVNEEFVNKI